MQKPKVLFGIHCHQPVGAPDDLCRDMYERAYLPILQALESRPRVKFSAYYSGTLYDWFQRARPEFMELIRKLVKRGQLELLTAGYYDPVFSSIPEEDGLGQIQMASDFIREHFLRAPRGLWQSGGAWDPSLPRILARAEVEYALIDRDRFLRAGIPAERLNGYFVTDELGETVKIFPVNRGIAEGPDIMAFMVEGERLPEEGYLEKLLSRLDQELEFTTFSNYLDEFPGRGKVYLSAGEEDFRKVFMDHPAADNVHKRMLMVSSLLQTLGKGRSIFGGGKKDEDLKKARLELYRGQCGLIYEDGNIQSPRLRQAAYTHLIKAEQEIEILRRGGKSFVELVISDFDKDGEDEVILSNDLLNLFFSPKTGGSLFELDYKPRALNLVGDGPLLLDHFFAEDGSEAGDFYCGRYYFMPRRQGAEVELRLSRDGSVNGTPVKVDKSVSLFSRHSIFTVGYEVRNLGSDPNDFWFGAGFDLTNLVDEESKIEVSFDLDKPALAQHSPSWKFRLEPGETWRLKATVRVEE